MGAQKDSNLLPGLLVYKLSSATGAVQQLPDFSVVFPKSSSGVGAGRLASTSTGGGTSSSTCSGSSPVPQAPQQKQQQQQQPSRIPTFSGREKVGKADTNSALGCAGARRSSNACIAGATPSAASCSADLNGFPATLPRERDANSTAAPPAASCTTESAGATSARARSLGCQLNLAAETVTCCQNGSNTGLSSGSSSSLKRPCASHDPSITPSRGAGLPIQAGQAHSSHFSCNGSSSSRSRSTSILNSRAEPCTLVKAQKAQLPLQRPCAAISNPVAVATGLAALPLAPAVSAHKASNKAAHSSTAATGAQSALAACAAAAAAVGAAPSPLLLQHLQLPSSVKALLALPHSQSQQRYRERQRVELYALNTIMAMYVGQLLKLHEPHAPRGGHLFAGAGIPVADYLPR